MTYRSSVVPRVLHADLVKMRCTLADGTVIPITRMYDATGAETDDGDMAVSFTAGPYHSADGDKWVAVSFHEHVKRTIQ